jgi:outer membrane biosynthesis protein TonB
MLSNNEQNERKYRIAAFAGTLLFHALVAGALLFLAFHTSLPLQEETGVEINFNYKNTNKGGLHTEDRPVTPGVSDSKLQPEEETEDYTETLILSEKKTNIPKPISGKIRKSIVETPDESTVVHKTVYSGSSNSNSSKQPVIPDKQDNPGTLKGSQNQNDPAGKGNGISFDLGGRKARILPKPSFNSSEDGKIVVSIKVNVDGKVISATAGDKGTTITEPNLYKQAENAARISLFARDSNAPEAQRGTITYFIVKQK